jgi:RNA 3'-terminal phosphate cyclase (ATP)
MGEGGGQVLRSSLSLSLITGTPFRIRGIRAKRSRPGLLKQHLTAVRAAAAVGDAETTGDVEGSTEVTFRPRGLVAGSHRFDIGSAGSATLVLQTVLPALITAPLPSSVIVLGGTHNPAAPPFDFLARSFLPLLARMGPRITATLERHGFYPGGGGSVRVDVVPVGALAKVELLDGGDVRWRHACAIVARLPRHIATRELSVLEHELGWSAHELEVKVVDDGSGPGNVLMAEIELDHVTEVFTGFGERTVRAEEVALRVAREVRAYVDAGVAVGEYLADQLLLPMGVARHGAFVTTLPSMHAKTQIDVLQLFLGSVVRIEEVRAGAWHVEVS